MFNMCRFLIFFTAIGICFSQCDSDDFSIQEDYFADHLIGFYLNSIDINTGDSNVEYFRYRIRKNDTDVNENEPNELEAHYSLVINSPDLNLFNFELVSGIVSISDFQIPELVFSNLDINFSTTGVPGASFILEESNMASFSELEAIQSIILSSGKIPNGTYILNVTLRCSENDNIVYDSITKTIEAYEPTFLDLVSPGGTSLQDTSVNTIMTTNPLFTWNSDYCSNCTYGIRVCKYDPSIHSSFSDAINDNSVLPSNQSLDFFSMSNNQSFSYPSNDAFDLMPGELYVWQINRQHSTTLGTQETKSPILVFKIYSMDEIVEDTEVNDIYSDLISALLGSQYDQLFGNNGELKGFYLKGNSVILNNETVPVTILYEIINMINNGEIEILEMEIE